MDGLWWPLGLIIVLLLLYWMIDITNKSANAYSKQIQIWFQWIHKFGTKLLWKVGVWQTFPKFLFEIEAGLNDLPLDPHLSRFTTDWLNNCFLKSTGKLLSRCTSGNPQLTWEEIRRIDQEKWSCNYFCHLLMTHKILHLALSLWSGEKWKCKIDFRTNTKDLTREIMAWWTYEKSFTCGWDIREEGCPVLQSTPS